ncbi:motor neuron and pancreas homeobox protein 1-like [Phacochoerus africanus]|uniref:motor neuron and pancreas homeobox protein 1-like n=1 Tax=Phacochoerus africanus TaxID=41426 RepID=UPI001FD94486|nr:motor neuron and pancreas homeobox protein 1-like [Phacochoerus africanus]
MTPGKAGAGTPELARVLFPRSELAGGGGGCNCTGDGDGGWRAVPGRGRAAGAGRGARGEARSPSDVGLRGGGFQGGLRAPARAPRCAPKLKVPRSYAPEDLARTTLPRAFPELEAARSRSGRTSARLGCGVKENRRMVFENPFLILQRLQAHPLQIHQAKDLPLS